MPEIEEEEARIVAEKILRGEPVTIAELLGKKGMGELKKKIHEIVEEMKKEFLKRLEKEVV